MAFGAWSVADHDGYSETRFFMKDHSRLCCELATVFCSDIGVLIKPTEVTWPKDQVGRFKPRYVSRVTGVSDRDRYSASGALAGKALRINRSAKGVDAS